MCAHVNIYLMFNATETVAAGHQSGEGRDQVQLVGLRQPQPPRYARHERGQSSQGT